MALIDCQECGNQVSEKAASCPKCGAPITEGGSAQGPVPVSVEDNELTDRCPFCMTKVHAEANVCPSCHAMKGYTHAQGRVYGRGETIVMGVVIPGIVALISLPFAFSGSVFGWLFMIVFSIPVILSIRRLKNGAIWFRKAHVH